LHHKTGEKVVVLVDEYDVPILDVMGKSGSELKAIQDSLHAIYKVLKGADDHLRFVFLTGVSKFAGLSIFSALNNLKDISLSKDFATICGITQEELEDNFPEYIDAAAKAMSMTRDELLDGIRKWYNGYSWDAETTVYNPFSTLLFFDNKHFDNFWFATGTPTFLIELLKKRNSVESYLQPLKISKSFFSSYDPERLETVPLLFQTGYLTIKEITTENGDLLYTLATPNSEVRNAFIDQLLVSYTNLETYDVFKLQREMRQQINNCDTEGLERSLRAMIAHVPYQLHIAEEKYYHSLLLVWLYSMGFKAQGELPTNTGRIDAVWELADTTVITEIKYDKTVAKDRLLEAAMTQIHDRKYYESSLAAGKKILLLAVAFSGKEIGCKIEGLRD